MTRAEVIEFVRLGVDGVSPPLSFGYGRISEFSPVRDLPGTWLNLQDVDSAVTQSAPSDSWRIELLIAKLDKAGSSATEYEELVNECDEIAQHLQYQYRNIVEGYKRTTIERFSRERFVKKYNADLTTGVMLSFTLIAPDKTNVC